MARTERRTASRARRPPADVVSWERKDAEKQASAKTASLPLQGRALERMRSLPTPVLVEWIDNSITKIGKLVIDSQRDGLSGLLPDAEREAAALVQALRELAERAV